MAEITLRSAWSTLWDRTQAAEADRDAFHRRLLDETDRLIAAEADRDRYREALEKTAEAADFGLASQEKFGEPRDGYLVVIRNKARAALAQQEGD